MSVTSPDTHTGIPAAPPYDPECAAVLDGLPRFPPLTAELIPNIREGNASLQRSNDDLAVDWEYRIEDHIAADVDGVLVPVLVCRPTTPTADAPALYYIHGGGLIAGSPRDALDTVLDLATSIGAVVVAVDYRLAPETPFPGGLNDCVTGLSWLFDHADEFGIDPARVIVLGGSAGGGLGAALSVVWRDTDRPPLAGQLLMSPMLDNRNNSVSAHQMANLRMWTRNDNAVGWAAYLGPDHLTVEPPPYAVPARTADFHDLPPTFIDVGSSDTFRDEDVTFANQIWAAGGHAELHVWPGGFHGYDGIAPHARLSEATIAARKDWLRRITQPYATPHNLLTPAHADQRTTIDRLDRPFYRARP